MLDAVIWKIHLPPVTQQGRQPRRQTTKVRLYLTLDIEKCIVYNLRGRNLKNTSSTCKRVRQAAEKTKVRLYLTLNIEKYGYFKYLNIYFVQLGKSSFYYISTLYKINIFKYYNKMN